MPTEKRIFSDQSREPHRCIGINLIFGKFASVAIKQNNKCSSPPHSQVLLPPSHSIFIFFLPCLLYQKKNSNCGVGFKFNKIGLVNQQHLINIYKFWNWIVSYKTSKFKEKNTFKFPLSSKRLEAVGLLIEVTHINSVYTQNFYTFFSNYAFHCDFSLKKIWRSLDSYYKKCLKVFSL